MAETRPDDEPSLEALAAQEVATWPALTPERKAELAGLLSGRLPAPERAQDPEHPAAASAETFTEVRVTYQYGVNGPQTITGRVHTDLKSTVKSLQAHIEHVTMGFVGITKVETRTVTRSPWTPRT